MEWIYSIRGKLTAALALAVVLGIMILINISEQKNSEKIQSAIATIYDDRLVVESYIFQYSQHLQEVLALLEDDMLNSRMQRDGISRRLKHVGEINEMYSATVLTKEEQIHFRKFYFICRDLERASSRNDITEAKQLTKNALQILPLLSAIQIKEARSQLDQVRDIYEFSMITLQLEIGVLVVIALLVQALVFGSKTANSIRKPKDIQMN
ncbi:MAG: MCP four helix bundle domain-containing protein [Flavobacterium sp.]|nr:MCP four helix bundle domain-containing protein [Flavobacterium sp.]